MDIQAISDAGTIAIACATVYLVAARLLQRLLRVFSAPPSFSDSIMSEAAQRFRDQLQWLSTKQLTYLGTLLVFLVMYGAVSMFPAPRLFEGYPDWQLYILLSALGAAALFALYRLVMTFLSWRQVRFLRDANIAIGHQLHRIAAGHGCTYHDVPTTAGVVDHVLIGPDGVYAINVVARRRVRKGQVRLQGHSLLFSNSKAHQSVVPIAASAARLQKQLSLHVGNVIRVRSVIAVPGWQIPEQLSRDHLLVNERTLPMITGWKHQDDYLMNEDVSLVQSYLTELCTRHRDHAIDT